MGSSGSDLGLVKQVELDRGSALVALVPRIPLTRKRERPNRPKSALFDAKVVQDAHGFTSVEKRNAGWVFEKRFYLSGLLELDIQLDKLTNIVPMEIELDIFRQTRDPTVVRAANSREVPLRTSEKMTVVAGSLVGLAGRVTTIDHDHIVTFDCDDSPIPLQVPLRDVRKLFRLGDFVAVVHGEFHGSEGFIVGGDNESGTPSIYRCHRMDNSISNQLPGEEVSWIFIHNSTTYLGCHLDCSGSATHRFQGARFRSNIGSRRGSRSQLQANVHRRFLHTHAGQDTLRTVQGDARTSRVVRAAQ
jgi:ribosomal protein L24